MTHKNQKKNRFLNRKHYSKSDIEKYAEIYLSGLPKFINPIHDKEYKTIQGIILSLAQLMDKESLVYFKFLISEKILCDVCKNTISFEDTLPNKMKTRCNSCYYTETGERKRIYTPESRLAINEKIGKRRLEFVKTDYGKEMCKNAGIKNSIKLKKFFSTDKGKQNIIETAIKQSIIMKDKIRRGEYTPQITNSWTKWDAIIVLDDGSIKKFRSSWEACFWYCNQHLLYEKIRIPYELDGVNHNYIVDFYDDKNKILYELKPKSFWLSQNSKMQAAINYCLLNSITLIWVNEYTIMDYIKTDVFFGDNLKQLEKMMIGVKIDKTKNKENNNWN